MGKIKRTCISVMSMVFFLICFESTRAVAADEPQTTYDWIRTLRPPLRGEDCPEAAGGTVGKPMITVVFAAGTTDLTEVSRLLLDQLASAIASDCLKDSEIELKWYPAAPKADLSLAEGRARSVHDYLSHAARSSSSNIIMTLEMPGRNSGGLADSIVVEVASFDRESD